MKCFDYHKQNNLQCENKKCRYWIKFKCEKNCALIAVENQKRSFTLQELGDIFNITRMRVCQIEKNAIKKIKNYFSLS